VKEAQYYTSSRKGYVTCTLCPNYCKIAPAREGRCGVRRNMEGKLYSLNYQEVTGYALDPIEKKPLYHYYPSKMILSFGTKGCNFSCLGCQNWNISQNPDAHSETISPGEAVQMAVDRNSFAIAYTYSEPLIWYEYVLETAKLARERGIKNVLVTNGYINEGSLLQLMPFIDAMNIDVKSMDEDFYANYCKGKFKPVLRTAELASRSCHVEITYLIVPTMNDYESNIVRLRDWISSRLSPKTPLHFSRYFPHYKMTVEATPLRLMFKAKEIAQEKLEYVYLGNVDEEANRTTCRQCGTILVNRWGYCTITEGIEFNRCKKCGSKVDIVV